MIRNYQKTSSDSNVDLSPIYNSLQTINALLYRLDVQTTIPNAINSISNSVVNIENKVDNITNNGVSSLAYFITDTLLTKNITEYNSYYNQAIAAFEPYVLSCSNVRFLNDDYYPQQRYNFPNMTMSNTIRNSTVAYDRFTMNMFIDGRVSFSQCDISTITELDGGKLFECVGRSIQGNALLVHNCTFNSYNVSNGTIQNCDIEYIWGSNCNLLSCFVENCNLSKANYRSCTLNNYDSNGATYYDMSINDVTYLNNCAINNCEINNINYTRNTNATNSLSGCYYSNCTFNNATLHRLTHTSFYNCSGNIYIPKIVNGSIMFDVNNNFLGDLAYTTIITTNSTYESNYSSTSLVTELNEYTSDYTTNYYVTDWYTSLITDTAISRVTTDTIVSNEADLPMYPTTTTIDQTITLSSTNTLTSTVTTIMTITENDITTTIGPIDLMSTSTYEDTILSTDSYTDTINWTETLTDSYTTNTEYIGNLTVLCLPEWRFNLSPNQVEISSIYSNQYINLEYYRNSTPYFSISNCNGNINLEVNSLSTLIILSNDLKHLNIDIENYTTTSLIQNTINNCVLNFYPQIVGIENAILSNSINNLTAYNNYPEHSIIFNNNTVLNGVFEANVNSASYRHSSCSYNNLHVKGWNGLYQCTIGYLENEGEISMSKCNLNTAVLQNVALLYDNTIDKLIINPNNYDQYSFMGNSIKTLVCPSNFTYMTEINTIGTQITY